MAHKFHCPILISVCSELTFYCGLWSCLEYMAVGLVQMKPTMMKSPLLVLLELQGFFCAVLYDKLQPYEKFNHLKGSGLIQAPMGTHTKCNLRKGAMSFHLHQALRTTVLYEIITVS
jgi:hypothetical protein